MVFRTCIYCDKFETDESKLHSRINKKGTVTICNIHISCKEEKEAKSRERNLYKPIIKEKKTIEDNINNTPEKQICSKCKDSKHISEFYQNRNFTYYIHCKKCHKEYSDNWKLNNTDKSKSYHSQYSKLYYKENKEKIDTRSKEYQKEYRKRNKEKLSKRRKVKYQEKKAKDVMWVEDFKKSKKLEKKQYIQITPLLKNQ